MPSLHYMSPPFPTDLLLKFITVAVCSRDFHLEYAWLSIPVLLRLCLALSHVHLHYRAMKESESHIFIQHSWNSTRSLRRQLKLRRQSANGMRGPIFTWASQRTRVNTRTRYLFPFLCPMIVHHKSNQSCWSKHGASNNSACEAWRDAHVTVSQYEVRALCVFRLAIVCRLVGCVHTSN